MLLRLQKTIVNISGLLSTILLVPMVIIAVVQVGSRYLMNNPVTFTEELLRFLLIWAAMLGAVYCFGTKRHLALGFLQEMLSNKNKKYVEILSIFINMLILIFTVIILLVGGTRIVMGTTKQMSATLPIAMAVVYSILPLSGVLITGIIGIDVIESIKVFIKGEDK